MDENIKFARRMTFEKIERRLIRKIQEGERIAAGTRSRWIVEGLRTALWVVVSSRLEEDD